ncbi:MAG: protoporphyrinogen oxidase [Tannerellaceae bacterium]|nr:protoporphyrinogen oxidase [Tannerellaceae bacterium]
MDTIQTDVVIIGAGLTGLTAAFHLSRQGKNVFLVECNDRTGGQIRTFREEGFTFESGPNTGAVSYPEVAELFNLLAPACQLETAHEEAKRRLIWKGNRFHALPSGPVGGLFTPLFSFTDKFRILTEPYRAKGTNPNETVGELVKRRLGKSYLDYAVDPFISGVYAGDPMTLVTRYALPKLYNLEQQHGSFIREGIAKAKEPKTERDKLATKKVFSASGRLSSLTDALAAAIGREKIFLSASHTTIRPENNRWLVTFRTPGKEIMVSVPQVITTTGAYALPELLPFVHKNELDAITHLEYVPIVQASVGVRNTEPLRFNTFSELVPSCEKRDVLGILFPSACFNKQAPEEGALFSFFIGGKRRRELTEATDEQLHALIVREFRAMLKFPGNRVPDMIRLFRHPRAIPQYDIHSGARFAAIEKIQKKYPGLILAGNMKGGIGMADRIRQGTALAEIVPKKHK